MIEAEHARYVIHRSSRQEEFEANASQHRSFPQGQEKSGPRGQSKGFKTGPVCWNPNCRKAGHTLRECKMPRPPGWTPMEKIAEVRANRAAMKAAMEEATQEAAQLPKEAKEEEVISFMATVGDNEQTVLLHDQ